MNYRNIYDNIIKSSKSKDRKKRPSNDPNYIYYERHHILPKCLGGNNDKENLVLLTAKEHYIAHKLLTFIYVGEKKIYNAFHYMTWTNTKIYPSAKDYEYAKKLKNIAMGTGNNPSCNKEIAKKIQKSNTGKKRSEESKRRYSISKMGHEVSKKTIDKINKTKKERGIIPWMVGKTHREESIEKLKRSIQNIPNKKCEYCGVEINPGNYARWHGNNCKTKT